jgi:SSS family solute:Na+ symporter
VALSVALVLGYIAVLAFVAVRARAAREYADFSLAKQSLPLALVFGSLCAAYVGPAFSYGFVAMGFKSGLLFLLVGLAYAVQNVFVGLFIAPRLRSLHGCHTLGDAVGLKYNPTCQVLAGVISAGLCAGFAAVMIRALVDVVTAVFPVEAWVVAISAVAATTLYTMFGGLKASVMTDAVQFTLFSVLLPALFLYELFWCLNHSAATFTHELVAATRAGFGSHTPIQVVGLVLAWLLGETAIPPYANRALATQTTRSSRNSFLLGALFSVLWFTLMISLGVVGRAAVAKGAPVVIQAARERDVLLGLVQKTMPVEGYALVLVAMMSVIVSSLDSLLNAGAVAFTQDVVRPFAPVSDPALLTCGRMATAAIALLAGVAALAVPSIIKGLLICYTVWAPAILPVLVFGLWLPKPRPMAGILSMAVGATTALMFQYIRTQDLGMPPILLALSLSLLAYLLGHVLGSDSKGNLRWTQ